jgi:hydrogenase/urease accessory protein HupE
VKRLRGALLLPLLYCATLVQAHEVRPGYLEFTESSAGDLRIVWRQPIAGMYGVPLAPEVSTGWLRGEPYGSSRTETTYVREWRVPAPHADLAGATVEVKGLERSITDVLLRVVYANGTEFTQVLNPATPRLRLPSAAKAELPIRQYLTLGFTHIWGGIDHLLYIVGLVLLVRDMRTLVKTITGFTVAHSMSLAAAVLGYVHVPSAPVEATIALSIVYVAAEVVRARQGRTSLARRAPWVIAFGFGLLHGLGFAGALSEVGLPAHDIPTALLLFNIGIEIGQLTFVALLLLVANALWRIAPRLASRLSWAPPYVIGSLASFWLFERIQVIF